MSQDPEDNCPDEWQTSPPNLHDVFEQFKRARVSGTALIALLESVDEQLAQGQADALQDNDEERAWSILVHATPAEIAEFRASIEQALREPQPPLVFVPEPLPVPAQEIPPWSDATDGWYVSEDRE